MSNAHRTTNLRNASPKKIHSEISTIQEQNSRSRSTTKDRHSPIRRVKSPSENVNHSPISASTHSENESMMIRINFDF